MCDKEQVSLHYKKFVSLWDLKTFYQTQNAQIDEKQWATYYFIFGLLARYIIGVARRGAQGARPTPNLNAINDKNVTKKPFVSSVPLSFSIFA